MGGGNPKFEQPTDPPKKTSSEGRYDLRPKFERGQTIKLRLEVTNLAEQPVMNVDVLEDPGEKKPAKKPAKAPGPGGAGGGTKPEMEKTKSRVEFGIVMRVKEVDDAGNSTVDMTFETVKMSIDSPVIKEEFDSTKPAKPAKAGEVDIIGQVLRPMVGTTMTMKIDRAGNISNVTGGEGFAMMGQITPGAGGSMPQVIGPIFTIKKGDGFARMGETWENADKLSSGLLGDITMTTRHTLSSVSGKDDKVDLKGKIEASSQAPGASTFQVKDSTYTGKYTWDLARGMIKDMTTKMSVRVEHKLNDSPVEVTSETTTKLTRID